MDECIGHIPFWHSAYSSQIPLAFSTQIGVETTCTFVSAKGPCYLYFILSHFFSLHTMLATLTSTPDPDPNPVPVSYPALFTISLRLVQFYLTPFTL